MPQVKPLLFQIDYVSPAIPAPPARRSNGAAGGWMSNIGRAIRTNVGREHFGNMRWVPCRIRVARNRRERL
jgi:hypothetical protein